MSIIKSLAQSGTTTPLAGTTWKFTYSGATGTISFSNSYTASITWPNGQVSKVIWAELNGSFWMTDPKPKSYILLFIGAYSGNQGSGTLVNSIPVTTQADTCPFTMTLG
jgi:hypothetical protein